MYGDLLVQRPGELKVYIGEYRGLQWPKKVNGYLSTTGDKK